MRSYSFTNNLSIHQGWRYIRPSYFIWPVSATFSPMSQLPTDFRSGDIAWGDKALLGGQWHAPNQLWTHLTQAHELTLSHCCAESNTRLLLAVMLARPHKAITNLKRSPDIKTKVNSGAPAESADATLLSDGRDPLETSRLRKTLTLLLDWLSIKLRTFDNLFVRISNESFIKSVVNNLSKFPIRRVDVQSSVSAQRENFLNMRNSLQEDIRNAFDTAGIQIPLPRQTHFLGAQTPPLPVLITAPEKSDKSTPT